MMGPEDKEVFKTSQFLLLKVILVLKKLLLKVH